MVLAAASAGVALGYGYLAAHHGGPRPAVRGASLSSLCDQPPTYFAGNARFKGSAPHPIAVFQQKNQADTRAASPVKYEAATRAGKAFLQSDAKQIQLVACSERARTQQTGRTCTLARRHVPFFRATYRVRVMAAATGHLVGEVLVHPQTDTCPPYPVIALHDPKLFSLPSATDYARALVRFSDRPAQDDPAFAVNTQEAAWRAS
ncbi:hypothetical protein [Streptomyces sp. NPDC058249]|uniref:hypothetical protein n=1 Tax=Streptomyces sp. NPDC058249 TaxID=3346403 RepID=UPI0036F100D0